MNPAQSARLSKEKYPNEWCKAKGCLWRTLTRQGYKPCPKHSEATRSETAVSAGNRQDASPGVGDTRTTEGITDPTATLARAERLASHDPKTCGHPRCRLPY